MKTTVKQTLWLVNVWRLSDSINIGTVTAVEETERMYYVDPESRIAHLGYIPNYLNQISKNRIGKDVFLSMSDAFRHASKLADDLVVGAESRLSRLKSQKMEVVTLSVQLVSEGKHREE